jgi:NADP-dependent alcohol dehydrogenase
VATLPERQIANGIIDSFVHTLEQYVTYPTGNLLQEREAEAILMTLLEIAPKIMKDPSNYDLAANLMWCSTHALNGNLRCGVPTDWATHMIAHELTAHFGIDHAQTLAIVGPRLYEHQLEAKKQKLAQYGKRVWGLIGSDDHIAKEVIVKTEEFFHSLGVKTKLSEHTADLGDFAQKVSATFAERSWNEMGENKAIGPKEVEEIVKATY